MGNNLFEISKTIVGARYKLGGKTKEEGLDCLTMGAVFLRNSGYNIPEEFEGITLDNYLDVYNNRSDWEEIYLRLIRSLGEVISIDRSLPGDLIVFKGKVGISVGINAGNGYTIAIVEDRIMKWPLNGAKIVEVIRCHR